MVDPSFDFTVRAWFCPLSPLSFLVIWWTVFISFRTQRPVNPFQFASLCVSDRLFGRFHHCSVEIVNGEGHFIFEDAEAVPEWDVEHLD